jgi:Icc protein
MSEEKKDELLYDHNHDGVDQQGFLKCVAWAGTGELCVIQGGVLKSYNLSRMLESGPKAKSILIERKRT